MSHHDPHSSELSGDTRDPRTVPVFQWTLIGICGVIASIVWLQALFYATTDAERARKQDMGGTSEVQRLHDAQLSQLSGEAGPEGEPRISIKTAMEQIVTEAN
ncbi:hypothetical protein OAX78_02455 [Planctomycetota bacterium]|nr:hypothetical protein [Planctomycetota bacterium]